MKKTYILSLVAGVLSAIGLIYQIWDFENAEKVKDTIAIIVQLLSGGLAINTGSKFMGGSNGQDTEL